MATRQMNYLRKHQKVILAVLGVVCMVTFVLGPFLLDLIEVGVSSGNSRENDPVAVTWVGGQVRDSDLQMKETTHQVAVQFLRFLIATVVDRGGKPIVSGVTITKEMPLSQVNLDIGPDSSEPLIVRMMLLARKADQLGISVDQQAAREYVESIAIPDVPPEEWQSLINKVTPQGMAMSVDQVLAQIAYDLKAMHMAQLLTAGLGGAPPGQMWEYHNRLNRRFVIEAYPIEVAPFGAQVQGEPTEAELRALFEKGKVVDPDPSRAEPGFHLPHKIAFQWLRIDRGPFVEAAMEKITDEEVAKQYELDKTQGKHKVIELPADPTKPADPAPGADPSQPAEQNKPADPARPDDDKPAADKPSDDKPETDDKPATDKPATDKPATDKPATDKPATDKPAAEENKPCAQEPATESQPENKPAEAKADGAQPADDKPAETKPGETPAAAPGTTPPATTPATTPPAATPAPPPKFKPLEEVKDDIRRELAQPIAEDEIKAAVKKATDEVNNYGRKYRRWKSAQDAIKEGVKAAKAEDPGKLDLEGIAARYGFKSGSTGLVDRHEIGKFEIGQKVMEFDMDAIRMGQFRQKSFAELAFDASDVFYAPSPVPVNSTEPDVSFVYWRTDESEEKKPELAEVRQQVVEAWKFAKALELAKAEAQKQADKAQSAASLKEVVADPTKVITTIPFSWLTTGSLAFGSGMPSLSQVDGIELAGTEFMDAVFSLKPGQAGVAPNQSHRTVYVVRVVSQEPSDDVLKEQFLESGQTPPVRMVANFDAGRIQSEIFESLDEELSLVWQRKPIEASRR